MDWDVEWETMTIGLAVLFGVAVTFTTYLYAYSSSTFNRQQQAFDNLKEKYNKTSTKLTEAQQLLDQRQEQIQEQKTTISDLNTSYRKLQQRPLVRSEVTQFEEELGASTTRELRLRLINYGRTAATSVTVLCGVSNMTQYVDSLQIDVATVPAQSYVAVNETYTPDEDGELSASCYTYSCPDCLPLEQRIEPYQKDIQQLVALPRPPFSDASS
jgi:septal ring factor EnvC (AmiA/AmiB activator)